MSKKLSEKSLVMALATVVAINIAILSASLVKADGQAAQAGRFQAACGGAGAGSGTSSTHGYRIDCIVIDTTTGSTLKTQNLWH